MEDILSLSCLKLSCVTGDCQQYNGLLLLSMELHFHFVPTAAASCCKASTTSFLVNALENEQGMQPHVGLGVQLQRQLKMLSSSYDRMHRLIHQILGICKRSIYPQYSDKSLDLF